MWSLKNLSNSKYQFFLVGTEYSVGRKGNDILILDDMSISRKHAILKVNHSERTLSNADKPSELVIKDFSKLGTQLPGKRISSGDEEVLKAGDVISFGTSNNNKFEVVCYSLIMTSSCLQKDDKKSLKKVLFKLGGSLLNEWTDKCMYVVMTNLSLTVKVACALLSQKHIVSLSFFEELLKHATTNDNDLSHITNKLANSHYLPVMSESQVNTADVSFMPLPPRSSVFKGKTFIFLLPDHLTRLRSVVQLASGATSLVDVTTPAFQMDSNVKKELLAGCVMLPESNDDSMQHQDRIKLVVSHLSRSQRRMIPESEVGFAILYCSTQVYCNPLKKSLNNTNTTITNNPLSSSINPSLSTINPPSSTMNPPSLSSINPSSLSSIKPPSLSTMNPPSSSTIKPPSSSTINPPPSSTIKPSPLYDITDSVTKVPSSTIKDAMRSNYASPSDSVMGDGVEVMQDTPIKRETNDADDEAGFASEGGKHAALRTKPHKGIGDGRGVQKEGGGGGGLKRLHDASDDSMPPAKHMKMQDGDGSEPVRHEKVGVNDSVGASINVSNHATSLPKKGTDAALSVPGKIFSNSVASRPQRHLDASFEPLRVPESKCELALACLVVRGMKASMVVWRGTLVPNYKRFTKIRGAQASRMIASKDLFEHSEQNLKSIDV